MSDEKKDTNSGIGKVGGVIADTAAKIGREIVSEASAGAAAAALTGGDAATGAVQGTVKAIVKQLFVPFVKLFDQELREQNERRISDGLAAAALAADQPAEEFIHELEAASHDDWLRTNLREPLRAMIEALDKAAVDPLGRLLADCKGKKDFDRRLLRGVARLLADAPGYDIAGLTVVVRMAVDVISGMPWQGVWQLNLYADGELTVLGPNGEVGRPLAYAEYPGGLRMLEELGMLHRLISQPEVTPMSPTQRPCETFYVGDDLLKRLRFYLVPGSGPPGTTPPTPPVP
jgi:hypothetical protein